MYQQKCSPAKSALVLLAALALALGLFLMAYRYDNKYQSTAPRGRGGVLTLTPQSLEGNRVVPLVDGWEFYDGLVAPGDFSGAVGREVFLGQYGNFSLYQKGRSPYGQATYRLRLRSASAQPLSLELPEIFSASTVYVNGKLVQQNGQVAAAQYQPYVMCTVIALPPGDCELVIQTANYTHYYSGLPYPPMLGTAQSISRMLFWRLGFYGLLLFSSAAIGLFTLSVWLFYRKNRLYLAFGLLCLFFALGTLYPFLHWIGGGAVGLSYGLEDFSSFGVLLCVVSISQSCAGVWLKKWTHSLFYGIVFALCTASIVFPLLILPFAPGFVNPYGYIIHIAKLFVFGYLLCISVFSAFRGGRLWLVAGDFVYALGLLADVLVSNRFEPIRFGWYAEYCGWFMVLIFSGIMTRNTMEMMRENQQLTAHLEDEVATRTQELNTLFLERKRFISLIAHDLKAPAAAIRSYTEFIRMGNVAVDRELQGYLDIIQQKSDDMQQRLHTLQSFNTQGLDEEEKVVLDLNDFLTEVYQSNLPDTDASAIYLRLHLPRESVQILGWRHRLLRVFENMICNAISFTPPGGSITIEAGCQEHRVRISLRDTGCGISPENLPHIFDCRFSAREEGSPEETRGFGLFFVKATVCELGGSIEAFSQLGKGTEFVITLPQK